MKKLTLFLTLILTGVLLVACSGSKDIQGTWKVQSSAGENIEIVFEEKTGTINGEAFTYTQNGTGIKNGLTYYLIKVQEGGQDFTYTIAFPEEDKETAIMIAPKDIDNPIYGTFVYAMSKKDTPDYKEYLEKYLE